MSETTPTDVKEQALTKFDQFSSMEEMMGFASMMIKSRLVPSTLKEPEQVVAIVVQGQELGFKAATALNNLHNIQGKVTLGIHAILALLKRSNIYYKIVEDFVYIREDGTIDPTPIYTKNEEGRTILAHNYVDKRTTIRFYEQVPFMQVPLEHDFSFSWKEVIQQQLHEKDGWKRMPKIMLRTRALALGARFVKPDVLLGMYETTEMAEVHNASISITEDGGFAYAEVID